MYSYRSLLSPKLKTFLGLESFQKSRTRKRPLLLARTVDAIIVDRCRGMLATRLCRRSTGISAHLSSRVWRSSPKFWGGLSIQVIALPNSSQIYWTKIEMHILFTVNLFANLNNGALENYPLHRRHCSSHLLSLSMPLIISELPDTDCVAFMKLTHNGTFSLVGFNQTTDLNVCNHL